MSEPRKEPLDPVTGVSTSDNEGTETAIATATSRLLGRPRLAPETVAELRGIAARYPEPRSALLPMLHLVQAAEGHVTPGGIEACAQILELSAAEVSAVATFYTMYKRRPVGAYSVGVCTNTLCAVMGGDAIFARLQAHLDIGNDETTDDGAITLEHVECNAACDYAPVVMVNWEFFDNQTPESAVALVDELRSGADVASPRGARVVTWRAAERVLAGFPDGRADEGPAAGAPTLAGLRIAREHGWSAPAPDAPGEPGAHPGPRQAADQSAYAGEDDVEIARSDTEHRTGEGNDAR